MHTMPVEPSPILMKLSRYSRGSPGFTTSWSAALNCSWDTLEGCWSEEEPQLGGG
ncbi:UNVERIFIED_CONTAM: hypothetical protein FKN15_063253 [Acipenser sinensis]